MRVTRGGDSRLGRGGNRGGSSSGVGVAGRDGAHDTVIRFAIKVVTVQSGIERLECVNRNTPVGCEALAGVT